MTGWRKGDYMDKDNSTDNAKYKCKNKLEFKKGTVLYRVKLYFNEKSSDNITDKLQKIVENSIKDELK